MQYEFDPAKSAANRDKHGIDFDTGQMLGLVPGWVVDLIHPQEKRLARIGQIDGKFWTAIYTMRAGRVRLISIRRARDGEVAAYERGIEGRGKDHQP